MAEPLVTVRLLGVPLDLRERSRVHVATLRRELALVEAGEEASAGSRLAELTDELQDRFGPFVAAPTAEADAARAAGRETVDLVLEVPVEAADAAERTARLLDEVDELCQRGELVTLVTPPDLVAFRRWVAEEVVEQIRHARPPRPWSGGPGAAGAAAQPRPVGSEEEVPTIAGPSPDVDPIVVDGDLDLLGAPAVRDAIAARLERGEHHLVVDLSDCGFLDSVGLSLLLTTRERCIAEGGSVRLIGVSDDVRELLRTVGVLELLVEEGGD